MSSRCTTSRPNCFEVEAKLLTLVGRSHEANFAERRETRGAGGRRVPSPSEAREVSGLDSMDEKMLSVIGAQGVAG